MHKATAAIAHSIEPAVIFRNLPPANWKPDPDILVSQDEIPPSLQHNPRLPPAGTPFPVDTKPGRTTAARTGMDKANDSN
jgi:hypothetical protein